MAKRKSLLGDEIAKASRAFEEKLGIAGDDQISRVKRRLLQPQIDQALREEAERLLAAAKALRPRW